MDRDANYVAVGAFVLLVTAMAASFVYWYTAYSDRHAYQRYEIYFEGTVSGLSNGSPVRYLGVDVGKVVRIGLDRQERNRVKVLADIDSAAPVDARTRASLSPQGITGLLYIDLQQDRKAGASGPLPQGRDYPVIASIPSDFDVLLASLPALATRAMEFIDHVDALFKGDNARALAATLDGVRRASERLPATLAEIQALTADMRATVRDTHEAVTQLRAAESAALPDVAAALVNARRASDALERTAARLDRFVDSNEPAMARFAQQGLPEMQRLLRESHDAAADIRELTRSLKENPSRLLYEPAHGGVEIAP